jgi:hypothetical protein
MNETTVVATAPQIPKLGMSAKKPATRIMTDAANASEY